MALLCSCFSTPASVTLVYGGGARVKAALYLCSSVLALVSVSEEENMLETESTRFCTIYLIMAFPFDAKYLVCTYHSPPQKLNAMVLLLCIIYLSYEYK